MANMLEIWLTRLTCVTKSYSPERKLALYTNWVRHHVLPHIGTRESDGPKKARHLAYMWSLLLKKVKNKTSNKTDDAEETKVRTVSVSTHFAGKNVTNVHCRICMPLNGFNRQRPIVPTLFDKWYAMLTGRKCLKRYEKNSNRRLIDSTGLIFYRVWPCRRG